MVIVCQILREDLVIVPTVLVVWLQPRKLNAMCDHRRFAFALSSSQYEAGSSPHTLDCLRVWQLGVMTSRHVVLEGSADFLDLRQLLFDGLVPER